MKNSRKETCCIIVLMLPVLLVGWANNGRATSRHLPAVYFLLLSGIPAEKKQRVQKLTVCFRGYDLLNDQALKIINDIALDDSDSQGGATAAQDSVENEGFQVFTFQEEAADRTIEIDETIDLDTEVEGVDIYPYATGQIQFTGSIEFTGDPPDPVAIAASLRVTFVTDVTVTDPDSGDQVTFAQDDSIDSTSQGEYSLSENEFQSDIQYSIQTDDLNVQVTESGGDPVDYLIDCEATVDQSYTDTEGEYVHSINATITVIYDDIEVEITIVIDNSTDPATEEITVSVNGTTLGTYSLSEFTEEFESTLLYEDYDEEYDY